MSIIRNLIFRPGEDLALTVTFPNSITVEDVVAQVRLDPTDLDALPDATFAASIASQILTLTLVADTALIRGKRYAYDVSVGGTFYLSGYLQVLPTVSR